MKYFKLIIKIGLISLISLSIIIIANKKLLNKSNANNINYNSSLTNSQFKQFFHYNIPKGFMNDIQTIIKIGDHYNIYYLANNIKNSNDGATQWNLVQTKDFKHFVNKGIALKRNQSNWKAVETGSVIRNIQSNGKLINNNLPNNALIAYFASNDEIYQAISTDNGLTFHSDNDNSLVLKRPDSEKGFRDPKVFYNPNTNKLVMYIVEGPNLSNGNCLWIHAYTKSLNNNSNWQYLGDVTPNQADFNNNYPGNFECPNIIPNIVDQSNGKHKAILLFSGNGGGHLSNYYYVGTLDNNGLFHKDDNTHAQSLDNGTDNYAANYLETYTNSNPNEYQPINSLTEIGWIGSWYHNYNSLMKINNNYHIGSFTLPRKLILNNDKLETNIIEPKNKLIKSINKVNSLSLNKPAKIELTFNKSVDNKQITINQLDNNTSFSFNYAYVEINQNKSMFNTPSLIDSKLNNLDKINKVVLYIDNSSIEMYLPQMHQIYTVMKLSQYKQYNLRLDSFAQTKIYQFIKQN